MSATAYRTAEEKPVRIKSRMRRQASHALHVLAGIAGALGMMAFTYAFCMLASTLQIVIVELTMLAGVLGVIAGLIGATLELPLRRTIVISLITAFFADSICATLLGITGRPLFTLAGLIVFFDLFGTVIGVGLIDIVRWLGAPREEVPAPPPVSLTLPPEARVAKELHEQPTKQPELHEQPTKEPAPLALDSSVDDEIVRQLSSLLVLCALAAPILVGMGELASLRLGDAIRSTDSILTGAASFAFFAGELLQLRNASARRTTVSAIVMIAGTLLCAAIADRMCGGQLHGWIGAEWLLLPVAMAFAVMGGSFFGMAVRAFGSVSPVLAAIAREEELVDDEPPVSEEDLPPSTRRLLDRVRARRKR